MDKNTNQLPKGVKWPCYENGIGHFPMCDNDRDRDLVRREVARKLRGQAKKLGPNMDAHEFANYTADVIDVGECMTWYEMTLRLADLIEPEPERTCRVESSHEEEGDGCYSYFEYELTCGHEIAWGDQLPPSYCPECGRRVLYDIDKYL